MRLATKRWMNKVYAPLKAPYLSATALGRVLPNTVAAFITVN